MISGRCECRRIRFEVEGNIDDYSHCHCSQCRRMHGAAFATFAGVARKNFRFLSGGDDLVRYESSPSHERTFCRVCGANIYVALAGEPEALYLCMGVIDGDPPRPPGYHIFVGSRAPWHDISDNLPQFDTEPDD